MSFTTSVPSSISVEVNSNNFQTMIDEWLDYDSDVSYRCRWHIVLKNEHDINSEISDSDVNSDDVDSNDASDVKDRKFSF